MARRRNFKKTKDIKEVNTKMFNSEQSRQFRENDWTANQIKRGKVVMTAKEMEEYRKRKIHPDSFAGDIDDEEEKPRIDEE